MSMALDDKQQGHDDEQLPELAEPRSTAEVAEALQASGMVDELLARSIPARSRSPAKAG